MRITIPVSQDFSLAIADRPDDRAFYATSHMQKGLALTYRGLDLAEEAVGFGLPVLKQGLQTFFPGEIELELLRRDLAWVVTAVYTINLVERIARPGTASVKSQLLYATKNSLAALIRHVPLTRRFLTPLSSGLRRLFGWETTYEKATFSTQIMMIYTFDEQTKVLTIEADLPHLPQSSAIEVIIMNEQGAHFFDRYHDSAGGDLAGDEIGCWDEVEAEQASFTSSAHRVTFTLSRVPGARLYRGRELIGSRLAWSGFGYSFPSTTRSFSYVVRIDGLL